ICKSEASAAYDGLISEGLGTCLFLPLSEIRIPNSELQTLGCTIAEKISSANPDSAISFVRTSFPLPYSSPEQETGMTQGIILEGVFGRNLDVYCRRRPP